jgi:glycosyltransferase involved in cell wall biosynthesis
LGLPQDVPLAVFCGHFDARKGPLRVLEAVRRLGIQGVFLGSNGPDRPAGQGVAFVGSVPNAQLPRWLCAANCFVLPSRSEGMSNAILEALACGLPIVASDRCFNTAFLNSTCAALVDPNDPDDIADGITHCLKPAVASKMAAASRALAMTLTIEMRITRIFAFVDEVGGRGTASVGT